MSAYAGPTEVYVGDNRIELLRKACLSASNALTAGGGNAGEIPPSPSGEYTGSCVPLIEDNEYWLLLKLATSLHRTAAL